jgi:hypothetical protein
MRGGGEYRDDRAEVSLVDGGAAAEEQHGLAACVGGRALQAVGHIMDHRVLADAQLRGSEESGEGGRRLTA